jgi:hypothetical protein
MMTSVRLGGVAGVAYVGGICNTQSSSLTSDFKNRSIAISAGTISHELGHVFGLEHVRAAETIMGPQAYEPDEFRGLQTNQWKI